MCVWKDKNKNEQEAGVGPFFLKKLANQTYMLQRQVGPRYYYTFNVGCDK